MFAIMNSKNVVAIDKFDGSPLDNFLSKASAVFFIRTRAEDVELEGKPVVKEVTT